MFFWGGIFLYSEQDLQDWRIFRIIQVRSRLWLAGIYHFQLYYAAAVLDKDDPSTYLVVTEYNGCIQLFI